MTRSVASASHASAVIVSGSLILDLLASGSTVAEILKSYPSITETDIQACIAYGAEMARERYVDLPLEPATA